MCSTLVLAVTPSGVIHAVDTDDGEVIWSFDSQRPLFSSQSMRDEKDLKMFIPGSDGSVYAITPDMPLTVRHLNSHARSRGGAGTPTDLFALATSRHNS